MKRTALHVFLAIGLVSLCLGCGGKKIDGELNIQLTWVCEPPLSEIQPEIEVYCIRVTDAGANTIGENCSSSLETLDLEADESSGLVQVEVEALDKEGRPIARGVSTPVNLVSGELNALAIPVVPLGRFSLVAGDVEGCQSLPFYSVGHSATVFPSGHVVVAGSEANTVNPLEAAYMIDPVSGKMPVLSTPASLLRFDHTSRLLEDGRLFFIGGRNQHNSALDEVVVMRGAGDMMGVYDKAKDYTRVELEVLINRLMVPRGKHCSSVLHGSQILVNDGQRTAEILLGLDEMSGFISVGGIPPVDPFPVNGNRTATVLPVDGGRAVVLGTNADHNGILTAEDDSRTVTFTPFGLPVSARDKPIGIHLEGSLVMFLGGNVMAAIPESPVIIIDTNGPTMHEVYVDEAVFPTLGYTATLLPDGRVLVAGGESIHEEFTPGSTFFLERQGGNPTAWDIYPGPIMLVPRTGHTASLLPDGRLLLLGGVSTSPNFTNEHAASTAEVIAF